jgi:hypothetical protein
VLFILQEFVDNLVTEEELPESEREKFMVILIADVVPFFLVSVQFGSGYEI